MPKKLLVEFTCSRCTRVWYEPYDPAKEEPQAYSFRAMMSHPEEPAADKTVSFECLCQRCAETVGNYIDSIGKDLKNKSPSEAKKKTPKASSSKRGKQP